MMAGWLQTTQKKGRPSRDGPCIEGRAIHPLSRVRRAHCIRSMSRWRSTIRHNGPHSGRACLPSAPSDRSARGRVEQRFSVWSPEGHSTLTLVAARYPETFRVRRSNRDAAGRREGWPENWRRDRTRSSGQRWRDHTGNDRSRAEACRCGIGVVSRGHDMSPMFAVRCGRGASTPRLRCPVTDPARGDPV
jgi:hypothetical protein